jgi:hypothetical protein
MENKLKRKPCYQDLINAEKKVKEETEKIFALWFAKFEEIINVFFELLYTKRYCDVIDIASPEYPFYHYADELYTELPCSLRSCFIDFQNGYYTDALGCCRSSLEAFVKLKYLFNRKDCTSDFLKTGKSKEGKTIRIIDTFEEIAPNSYKKNYKFLCSFVHKGAFTSLPSLATRLNSQLPLNEKQESFFSVPIFSRHLAEIVIKHLLALISGYLNNASHFLSDELNSDPLFFDKYQKLKKWVNLVILKNKESFPNSQEWSEFMEEIAAEPQELQPLQSP